MQPINDILPEATDELLEKYKLKFSVMTNPIAGGCLVAPDINDYRGTHHYELRAYEVLTITSMVQLLLKRVETDKIKIDQLTECNQILQRKLTSTDGKLGKLMSRISGLQSEVDAFQQWKIEHVKQLKVVSTDIAAGHDELHEENQRLRQQIDEMTDAATSQEESFTKKLDHISLFVRVLIGVYPKIDIFYVRNIIKQLLEAQ